MPLKKTVAMERRIDLASLFCLIARHGPAVLVTLLLLGCSVAGFIMFRNMREKRRRRRAAAGSERGDGDAEHSRGAALGLAEEEEPCPGEEAVWRRGSTDDEDGYHEHVRHRRAAPERTSYKDKIPDGDTAADKPPFSFFWQRHSPKATESRVEETRRDYNSERSFSHAYTEDVTAEVCGAKEPGLTNDVAYEEKEKVIEADSSEDITSTTEEVSDEEFAQEETAQFTFTSQLCSAPTATLGANDGKETAEEINIKQDEHEESTAPVKQEEILSAPCVEEQKVGLDQVHDEQNLPLQCDKPAALPHLNDEKEADAPCDNTVSTILPVIVAEEHLVGKSQNETCESGPLKSVDTKDECNLVSTADTNVVFADMSSNGLQQSEPAECPTLETDIDQNALCPQELSDFKTVIDQSSKQNGIGLEKTACDVETSDVQKGADLETVSNSHDLNMAEDKSPDHQETTEETEISTEQNHHEILPQGQASADNLSDEISNTCEETQAVIVCEESNLNGLDQKEGQSSCVDFKVEECLVQPPAPQSQLDEVMEDETSPSSLPAQVKEEISTGADTTVQTNHQKPLEGTSDLDTETILPATLPSQTSEDESNQTCQTDESVDTTNISATTRGKLETMVEQMVAEAYKDVTQTAVEDKPMQLDENSSELAQNSDGIAPDNLAGKDVEKEVVIKSNTEAQPTEAIVNSAPSSNISDDEVQKGVVFDVSESKSLDVTFSDGSNTSVTEVVPSSQDDHMEKENVQQLQSKDVEKEAVISSNVETQSTEEIVNSVTSLNTFSEDKVPKDVVERKSLDAASNDGPNAQDANQLEKDEVELLVKERNVQNDIPVPEDVHLMQGTGTEVKSEQLEQNSSLEQLAKQTVQPILDINGTVHERLDSEPVVKLIEQEMCTGEVCSNMAAQRQAEMAIVSSPEVRNIEKVEGEKVIVETSHASEQSDQKELEARLDTDNGLSNKTKSEPGNLLEKGEGAQETPSSNEVQSEQKESDTGNNVTVKSSKVVIVCRTLESSISTLEMSDDEDVDEVGETSLERISCKSSFYQDHIDINKKPADEKTDLVACSNDTFIVQTVTREMETGKQVDFASAVTLDIPQDSCGASVKSSESIEQKDDVASTPSLESGISSMAVSPEKEESCKVMGQDVLTTCQVYAEEKVSCSVFTSNGVIAVTEETSVEIRPLASGSLQISAEEEMSDDLSVTNEDLFGSDIEDDYVKATEELMMKVVNNFPSNDVTKESVKLDVKKEQACVAKTENGEKADSEKTDISIMEATMDHNEWITEGNYQVLPWMAMTSFSKEAKDVVENKLQPQASSSEESVENAKKVLAVQPMPQNVNVTFRVHYVTLSPHQTVAVTGDQPELGAWKSVVPLEKTKDGYWTCVVGLPAESHVEWKFVVLEKGQVCRWEECGNRLLYTGFGDELLVHKWWGFL